MAFNPLREIQGRARTIVVFMVSQNIMVHFLSLGSACVNERNPHPIWLRRTTAANMHVAYGPILLVPSALQKIRKTDLAFGNVVALFCSVSSCLFSSSSTPALFSSTLRHQFIMPVSCSLPIYPLDYVRECIVGTGQNYRGRRSVTVSGILCQAWASPIPHEHK